MLRRKRLIRRLTESAVVAMVVVAVAGLPVYVRPQTDPPRRADAILVLGGEFHQRYPFGLALATQGLASTVVLSNPGGRHSSLAGNECANPPAGIVVQCFEPDPSTTKGEGRELRRLAQQYGWKTVIVVTFEPHISRARYILHRCFDGDLIMVASPSPLSMRQWAWQYVYQTFGYLRELVQPGC